MTNPVNPLVQRRLHWATRFCPLYRSILAIQKTRVADGNRVIQVFKAKLGVPPGEKEAEVLDEKSRALLAELRAKYSTIATAVAQGRDEVGDGSMAVTDDEVAEDDSEDAQDERDPMAKLGSSVIDLVVGVYNRAMEGKKRDLSASTFVPNPVISDPVDLVLARNYIMMTQAEDRAKRDLRAEIERHPIGEWLLAQIGVGEMTAGLIMSSFNVWTEDKPSSWIKYAGLDVVPVTNAMGEPLIDLQGKMIGEGRTKQERHLVDREYVSASGVTEIRKGTSFKPLVKTKLVGVLATNWVKMHNTSRSPFYDVYVNAKARMLQRLLLKYRERTITVLRTMMERIPASRDAAEPVLNSVVNEGEILSPSELTGLLKRFKAEALPVVYEPAQNGEWIRTALDVAKCGKAIRAHADLAGKRVAIKQFLITVYKVWRALEGLPIRPPYEEEKLGIVHSGPPILDLERDEVLLKYVPNPRAYPNLIVQPRAAAVPGR
jgi:hypothetical protein